MTHVGALIRDLASGDENAVSEAKKKADEYIQKFSGSSEDLKVVAENRQVVNNRPSRMFASCMYLNFNKLSWCCDCFLSTNRGVHISTSV